MKAPLKSKNQVKQTPKQGNKKRQEKTTRTTTKNPSIYLAITLVISITIMLFTFIIPYRQSLFPVEKSTPQTTVQMDTLKREDRKSVV